MTALFSLGARVATPAALGLLEEHGVVVQVLTWTKITYPSNDRKTLRLAAGATVGGVGAV